MAYEDYGFIRKCKAQHQSQPREHDVDRPYQISFYMPVLTPASALFAFFHRLEMPRHFKSLILVYLTSCSKSGTNVSVEKFLLYVSEEGEARD